MDKTSIPIENSLILESVNIARRNWDEWKVVFEHTGAKNENPLLTDPEKFKRFLKEYSLYRTIRKDTSDKLRSWLVDYSNLSLDINDDRGAALDRLNQKLKPDFGTHDGKRGLISFLSKVAAFLRPEVFVAWDQWAKKGLKEVLGHKTSYAYKNYAEYLEAIEESWKNEHGQAIRDYIKKHGVRGAIETEPRFQRRVLDVYLMSVGGRWK